MGEFSQISLERIIDRCLTRFSGQKELITSLVSNNSYHESWAAFMKWTKYELDLGRAIKVPGLGLISLQTFKEDPVVYFRLDDAFLKKCDIFYEELQIKENKYPVVTINYSNIKKLTSVEREVMRQAIENIFSEIAQIFLEFYAGNFQLDLGSLGKFLLADKVLRFMPYVRNKKAKVEKKMTIKGMIDMNLRKLPLTSDAKHAVSNVGSFGVPHSSPHQAGDSILQSEQKMKQSYDMRVSSTPENPGQVQQFSQIRSVFQGSPTKRSAPPPPEDLRENNLMFGAGTDPLALNQNYSLFASNPNNLMGTVFSKPPYARIRCPPVIDLFSRTQAAPVASQYNSLSSSSRIGLFYSIATKYLYFDPESNEISYLKIKENKTKLTANEELLKAMATEQEEIKFLLDPQRQGHLHPKIEAKLNCYKRYREYIEREIPMEIVAPIRQYWITNVLDLIPANQKDLDQSEVERIIDQVLTEINGDYYNAVKKSILDYILKEDSEKLRIGILQRFDEPVEYGEARPKGVIADQFWVDKVEKAREDIRSNLVNYNHATLSIIALWQEISQHKYFKLPQPDDPKEIPNTFINKQKQNIRDVQEKIKSEWISAVSRIYQNELGSMENAEIAKFFTATKILMSTQLRDLIYSSLKELKEFISRFERSEYLNPKQCIANDNDRTKALQKSFLVVKIEKTLKFSENPDTIRAEILRLVDDVVASSENVPLPQNKLARLNEKTLCPVNSKDDEVVNEVRRYIDKVITDNLAAFEKVLEIFAPFKHLLTEMVKLEGLLKAPATLKEYEKMIQGYKAVSQKVEEDIPFEIYMGLVLVDCREAREELLRNCDELVDKILSKIDDNMRKLNTQVGEDTKNMFDLFDSKNSTRQLEADYFELCDKRKDSIEKTEKKKMINNFKEVTEMLWFLYRYRFNVELSVLTSINATASSVDKIDEELKRARDGLSSMKEQIKKKLSGRKELFDQSLKTLEENLKTIKGFGIEDVETAMGNVRKIDELVNDCIKESKEINHIEDKIREKKTAFELLDKTIALVDPFRDFWNVVDRYSNEVRRWMEREPVLSLDYSEVMNATKQMNGTIATVLVRFESMEEKPDKAIKETRELIKKLRAFTDKSPLINALASKSMQDRHWKEVNGLLETNGITDMHWSDSATWKLIDCDKNGLNDLKAKLLEISEKSEREYKNFKQLEEMVTDWEGVTINLKPWKETNSFVILGDSVDTIQAILDDHIIKTQTMKGSQFAKVFDTRISKWEADLLYLRDTLEVWLKVQANWIYLQPIFASPDIKKSLPNEEGEFKKVNDRWKDLMSHTSNAANSKAIAVPKDQTLKDTLKGMLERLEGVQEKLMGYLDMKRSKFPRFYFLSEDSLIEVLSEARDPTKVQKYCKVLFEGIKVLDFSKEDVIMGMKSSEGEFVKYEAPVQTRLHLGLVEAWLQILEDTMVLEVRRNIENAFNDFHGGMPREEFVLNRMGQAVLNVDMTVWTLEAEKAIREGRDGLPKFLRKLDQDLQRIVLLVKKNISMLDRCTLEALIVLDVHNKEVIRELIEARVTSVTDFDYEAQLRYYWDTKSETKQLETIVKMVNTTLDYNYEYLGNSARLVITPLTDRCYRTLCGAIGLNYGGAPEGPAGTGKTETVKDLAKALARMIVVFNCTGGITYKYMERFFKGLCSTGGWSCLDEFNRIELEVLSVIAQQLQCIQNAIKDSKSTFEFAGSVIRLKPTCNSFITMNPGYAGRSELPDNLKALFRSVAMMVPDYALIGEIRLYSFGFSQAQGLAKKIVTTYKLCSEQISAQKHYDYGMRAVNSVLLAAGNLRKAAPNGEEDVQILRAINEVNEAKFLNIDLPLFKAITLDLFPETKIPAVDLTKLMECLREVIVKKGLQDIDYFIDKIIQIYQMVLVRHGLMVVGEPYGGKSTAIDVLADGLGLMHQKYGEEMPVETIYINPKSITNAQLYGASDKATGEWTDGVLPAKFKKMANDETNMRRWLCFDGPVDAVWIEDMNTVLDDNKKLCLSNGDIFYMSSVMNLIFEPMDLLVASPATVSRCGMIFIEPHIIGWMHLYKSWKLTLPPLIQQFEKDEMDLYFTNIFTPLIKQFEKGVFELTAPSMVQNVVSTLFKLAKPYFQRFENKEFYEAMEFKERRSYFDKVFAFATIWSLGATLTVEHRQKFDSTFKKLINSPDSSLDQELAKKHRKIELPEGGSGRVFESTLDVRFETLDEGEKKVYLRWIKWSDLPRNSTQEFAKTMQPNEMIVNTVDLVRYSELIEAYIQNSCHVLICGPTGTGKTIYIKRIISSLNKATNQSIEIGFSAQTTASQVQEIIDTNIIRRSKGVYGPPPHKKLVIFVDDLGMPKKETYGAQPPIELLRQLIGRGGWYDLAEKPKPFKTIQDVVFLAAMGQPGSGRNEITPRFQRLMSLISFTTIDDLQMELIFKTILSWRFSTGGFNDAINKLAIPIVKATLVVYTQVTNYFKPLPSKSHYLFNLRDFAKVIFGICMGDSDRIKTKEMLTKLWIHEVWRVFGDRLTTEKDRLYLLNDIIKKTTHKAIGENMDNLLVNLDKDGDNKVETLEEIRGLIFTDVMSGTSLKVRPYEIVVEYSNLTRACETALAQYDMMNEDKPLNIVLFGFAIEHLLIISRVLKQPGGNALLVGIGGSGRQSLTKLAAKIADHHMFQIELSKNYGVTEWKDDLKKALKMAGGKAESSIFLFRDSQIKYESFIEDINNLLNNGEVPNLFPSEERGEILELSRKNAKDNGKEGVETPEQLMALFTETVKKKLHVVLCFSPIGSNFRNKIRMFPSLVNCCTIDWFFEWPEEALFTVASKFVGQTSLKDASVKDKCVEMVKYFHMDTQKWAADFLKQLRRQYYVTPTSFIDMINQFKSLLIEKTDAVSSMQQKYENGYKMIIEAESSVEGIKAQLKVLAPQLEVAQQRGEVIAAETEVKKKEAEVVSAVVAEEKISCEAIADNAKAISDECQAEMSAVIPEIKQAGEKLELLDDKDFVMLKGSKVPLPLLLTSQCLAIVLKQPEEKFKNEATMKIETDWRKTTQKLYTRSAKEICEEMKAFNKADFNNIDFEKDIEVLEEKTYQKIKKLFEENPSYLNEDSIKRSSEACANIFTWIEAQVKLQPMELAARPKRQKYKEAKQQFEEAQAKLESKVKQLKDKQDELSMYTKRLEITVAENQRLKKEFETCKLKLERSEILIENLRDEKDRWRELSEILKLDLDNLVGDVLVSSAVISYLGPFTSGFRSQINKAWTAKAKELKLPGSEEMSLVRTFGDPVQIRNWQIRELPSDDFSTENAIILNKSRRWSLCIDPQIQANKWIKNMESEKLIITNLANNFFMRDLERAIRMGLPCLLENVGEEIDAALDPILLKQIQGQGSMATIKLGDKVVDYIHSFFLYITTKERNPHYLPEVSTKVTIINFMITSEGLSDQLLGIIVKAEMPKKEEEKVRLITEGAANKEELRRQENQILRILEQPKDKLLDDETAINALTMCKKKSNEISEKQKIAEVTEKEINEARKNYEEISRTGSCLFFAISDLGFIDPMYQYSLTYYIDLFKNAIQKAEPADKHSEVQERLPKIEAYFLYSLYLNISRSLFVKDKLLLSFLLSVRLKQFRGEISDAYYSFFLTGSVGKPTNWITKPRGIDWLTDYNWENVCRVSEFKNFDGIHTSFESMIDDWERIYNSLDPVSEPLPPLYEQTLNHFEKMMIVKILRPDKLVPYVQQFVIQSLGRKFVEIPAFDLESVFAESTKVSPLIFVLTPGVDPYNMLKQFADKKGVGLEGISLGQGQGEIALKKIEEASDKDKPGFWVVLQNCHLAETFMNPLEKKCDEMTMNPGKINENFRLWLTSYPSKLFPSSILQNGVKMTNEPPSGLKNNLKSALMNDEISNPNNFNKSENLTAYRRLVFGLCFFHSVIQERRKFGPLGWNIPYEFTESDLRISAAQLRIFINKYRDELPLPALKYLTAECNYGGRVTDDKDRRLIKVLLEDYYNKDVAMYERHELGPPAPEYYIPNCTTFNDYLKYVDDLPLNTPPGVYGFHSNANITKELNETSQLVETLLMCQGGGGSKGGEDTGQMLKFITKILDECPNNFNDAEARERYPPKKEESMNIILIQELNRFNKLISTIRSSLGNIRDAMNGLIVFSFELEETLNLIRINKVPKLWMDNSYPSLKPLPAYMENLRERVKKFSLWVAEGKPAVYSISSFFFPQGFLTGIQQNFARKYGIAIDKLAYDFEVLPQHEQVVEGAEDGAYVDGFFLEGAKFDYGSMSLGESDPKKLFVEGPKMYFKPVRTDEQHGKKKGFEYDCPLYRTGDRRGVLMTTGHSTNFVMMIKLPSEYDPRHWIKRGVAAITQLNE